MLTCRKRRSTRLPAKCDAKTQLTNSYNAQFTALNTLMAHMSSNASYLTALFGGANSAGALAGNKG